MFQRLRHRDGAFLAERVAQGQDAGGGNGEAQHGNHDTDSDKGLCQGIMNLGPPRRNCGNYAMTSLSSPGVCRDFAAGHRPFGGPRRPWPDGSSPGVKIVCFATYSTGPHFLRGRASFKEPSE
ncbi:hypothetical protein WJ972_17775 [Achromobacter insuavis]